MAASGSSFNRHQPAHLRSRPLHTSTISELSKQLYCTVSSCSCSWLSVLCSRCKVLCLAQVRKEMGGHAVQLEASQSKRGRYASKRELDPVGQVARPHVLLAVLACFIVRGDGSKESKQSKAQLSFIMLDDGKRPLLASWLSDRTAQILAALIRLGGGYPSGLSFFELHRICSSLASMN